jgi:hypothetical protein
VENVVFCVFSLTDYGRSVLRLAVRGNSICGWVVRQSEVCRCLRGIDCRRPEVDGTYGRISGRGIRGFFCLQRGSYGKVF